VEVSDCDMHNSVSYHGNYYWGLYFKHLSNLVSHSHPSLIFEVSTRAYPNGASRLLALPTNIKPTITLAKSITTVKF